MSEIAANAENHAEPGAMVRVDWQGLKLVDGNIYFMPPNSKGYTDAGADASNTQHLSFVGYQMAMLADNFEQNSLETSPDIDLSTFVPNVNSAAVDASVPLARVGADASGSIISLTNTVGLRKNDYVAFDTGETAQIVSVSHDTSEVELDVDPNVFPNTGVWILPDHYYFGTHGASTDIGAYEADLGY